MTLFLVFSMMSFIWLSINEVAQIQATSPLFTNIEMEYGYRRRRRSELLDTAEQKEVKNLEIKLFNS